MEWLCSCQASYGTLWLQEDMAQLKCRKVVEVLLILLKKETSVPQINIDRTWGQTLPCFLRQNAKKHDTFKHWNHLVPVQKAESQSM